MLTRQSESRLGNKTQNATLRPIATVQTRVPVLGVANKEQSKQVQITMQFAKRDGVIQQKTAINQFARVDEDKGDKYTSNVVLNENQTEIISNHAICNNYIDRDDNIPGYHGFSLQDYLHSDCESDFDSDSNIQGIPTSIIRPISNSGVNNESSQGNNKSDDTNNSKSNNQNHQHDNNRNDNNTLNSGTGGGGGGDDEKNNDENKKHKDNDSYSGKNSDDDDDEENDKKTDEDEEEEEKQEVFKHIKLNASATPFISTVSPIVSRTKSYTNAPKFVLDPIVENDHETEEKKLNEQIKSNVHLPQFVYEHHSIMINESKPTKTKRCNFTLMPTKCAATIEIPRNFTKHMIPSMIKENISNIYYFMDKSMALRANKRTLKDENLVIINYDFHDKDTNEMLYCIVQKQKPSIQRRFNWIMIDKLFTKKEILIEFNISEKELILPSSSRFDPKIIENRDYIHSIGDILRTQLMHSIAERTQWHRLPVDINKTNNRKRKVLHLTKKEFTNRIEYFSKNCKHFNIIPVMIINSNKEYWIEHIYITQIDENVDIGISLKYKPHRNRIEVTGIHLDKQYILNKHQLAAPNHNCVCLDHFQSDIDDLRIGNIDQDKNKIKDLKKRHEIIKNENEKNKNKVGIYKQKYKTFKHWVKRLTNQKIPSPELLIEAKTVLKSDNSQSPITLNLNKTTQFQYNYDNHN